MKIEITKEELRGIVKETVHETLIGLGVDSSNPVEMQKDLQHLRDWRLTMAEARRKGLLTIVGIFVAGVLAFLWIGFKMSIGK